MDMENGRAAENGAYQEVDIIEVENEDGETLFFEKVAEFEFEEQEYALMIYRGDNYENAMAAAGRAEADDESEDEEDAVLLMRIVYEDGVEAYEDLQNNEERQRVAAYLETFAETELDFSVDVEDFLSEVDADEDAPSSN